MNNLNSAVRLHGQSEENAPLISMLEGFNEEQVKICVEFLRDANLPETLLCINQLCFQSMSDPLFRFTDEQRDALEALTVMLIKCWASEKAAD